jgi:hypothetical protein
MDCFASLATTGALRAGCEIIPKRRTIGKIAFVIGPTSKLPTIVLGGESGDIDAVT